jgi:hypothetical protein
MMDRMRGSNSVIGVELLEGFKVVGLVCLVWSGVSGMAVVAMHKEGRH